MAFLGVKKEQFGVCPIQLLNSEVVLPEQMAEDLAGVPAGRVTTGRERDTNLPVGKGCGGTTAPLGAGRGVTSTSTKENPSIKCRAVGKLTQQCLTNTPLYFHSEGG